MAVRLTDFSFDGQSIVRDVFIETGTFQGETLARARDAGFRLLHSVEVYETNYLAAQQKFAHANNVHLHMGSSPKVLPRIIDRRRQTTFWLDAHFQGGDLHERDPEYGECPLLAELTVVFCAAWDVNPLILIDDAYMFDHRIRPGFDVKQWPSLSQIGDSLPKCYELVEVDEVLYCVPPEWRTGKRN